MDDPIKSLAPTMSRHFPFYYAKWDNDQGQVASTQLSWSFHLNLSDSVSHALSL